MGQRSFTISNPNPEDEKYFRDYQTKTQFKAYTIFSELIAMHKSFAGISKGEDLSTKTTEQANQIEQLNTQITEQNHTIFSQAAELELLKERLQELTNQNNQQQISPPAYVYRPTETTFNQMRRYFAYLRKEGKITTQTPYETLTTELTQKAITYLFKNEFPQVIK